MSISLDYAAPDEALREMLSVFYEFRADLPLFEADERADYAQIRFVLSGRGHYRFADGHECDAPPIVIVGPTTGNTHSSATDGPIHIFGAGILPAGWAAIVGLDASTFANRVIDARELFGTWLDGVMQELRFAPDLAAKVEIGNRVISTLSAQANGAQMKFTRIVDQWLESSNSPSVDDLAERLCLSSRQVERQCKRVYGIPPKMLARKYRALRAAMTLARGEADMDDVIGENFCDQSHLIREIKAFTGITPGRFKEDLPELAKLTLKRAELAGEVRPIIYET